MPRLPSGRSFGVNRDHILEPGTRWFACPAGHFWYQTPDLAINAPPFHRDQTVLCDFVHAPVPASIEEMARYVDVIEILDGNAFYRTGMRLDCDVRPDGWTEADWDAWNAWRHSDRVATFLRESIERCRAQAEANQSWAGDSEPPGRHDPRGP